MSEVIERDLAGEHDAGKPSRRQQLREGTLRLPGFEGYAIQQQLVVGHAEQKAGVAALGQSLLQLVPSRLELTFRALVIRTVQPGVLDQNIEAVQERPGGRVPAGISLSRGDDSAASSRRCASLAIA